MLIIPVGVDCSLATIFKEKGMRKFSSPFDWIVSYNGVTQCIDDDFKNFIPKSNEKINEYDMYFHHDFNTDTFQNDETKYLRRIQRLQHILENPSEPVVFVRKSHTSHHHSEHNGRYTNIKNDLEEAEKLDVVLSNKYKKLNYKILVILVCEKCFDRNITYKSKSSNIYIHNIVMTPVGTPPEKAYMIDLAVAKVLFWLILYFLSIVTHVATLYFLSMSKTMCSAHSKSMSNLTKFSLLLKFDKKTTLLLKHKFENKN